MVSEGIRKQCSSMGTRKQCSMGTRKQCSSMVAASVPSLSSLNDGCNLKVKSEMNVSFPQVAFDQRLWLLLLIIIIINYCSKKANKNWRPQLSYNEWFLLMEGHSQIQTPLYGSNSSSLHIRQLWDPKISTWKGLSWLRIPNQTTFLQDLG